MEEVRDVRECARCGFRVAQPPSETVTRLQAAPSSRDFETVIWPRNLRKCRRWLEFSDKRDRPRHGIKRRRRGDERERERKRGREGRRLGRARARGGDTTHRRMWKEAEETMVTVIIFLSRPVTAQPTR